MINLPPYDSPKEPNSTQIKSFELIQFFVDSLPEKSGVYRMIGKDERVLYVGKAKNLKKRVSSYARAHGHSNRILRMINETINMQFIITETETEALLLEANLIKKLKPIYNILLRDDKSFPYITINKQHPYPGIYKHRGAKSADNDYFGPFANNQSVNHTIKTLQKAFLLRSCSDSFFLNRTRPCLLYQIKRCSAPCTKEITQEDYLQLVQQNRDFLLGKSSNIRQDLVAKMQHFAKVLDFEQASIYRDRLKALADIQAEQHINHDEIKDADFFAIFIRGNIAAIEVFFYRLGQNWGNHTYFINLEDNESADIIMQQFILQFYDNNPPAKEIAISNEINEPELVAKALSLKAGYNVKISIPQKGAKKSVLRNAFNNAKEALARRLTQTSNQKKLLHELFEKLQLKNIPKRIEIYDNSHIMGQNSIGAMVVAGENGFEKNCYRKFNISDQNTSPGDDFAMMREVLRRRFTALLNENAFSQEDKKLNSDDFPIVPDLIIIDGGAGQLSSVIETLDSLSSEVKIFDRVDILAIAKGVQRNAGRETFHMPGRAAFSLPPRSDILFFLQNLRDEAHRYAITSHRIARKKSMLKNPLDEINSIGAKRKKALLNHFGSSKAVSQATVKDLMRVEGISENLAKIIYDHFH